MNIRERILLGVIASCLTIAVLGPCEPQRQPSPVVIQEDDAGWDCATMGNRICGR